MRDPGPAALSGARTHQGQAWGCLTGGREGQGLTAPVTAPGGTAGIQGVPLRGQAFFQALPTHELVPSDPWLCPPGLPSGPQLGRLERCS